MNKQATTFDRLFVWTGGTLFVLSLGACAYDYLFAWSDGSASGGHSRAVIADVALFAVFASHHSLLARESAKRYLARACPSHLLRSLYVWTASLLLLAVLTWWRPVAGDLYDATGWRALVHGSVQLAGIWIIARSVAAIDALELAGIKPARSTGALQVVGPYRWVRHPLYLGWILAVFGAAHMTANRLLFAAITTAYLLVAIPWEERSLARAFGDDYARYKGAVRWRVIPRIY